MSKHYFALELDHAQNSTNHVLFKIGTGYHASAIPQRDLYRVHNMEESSKLAESAFAPTNQKMLAELAANVEKVYIVNVNIGMVLESFSENFLKSTPNLFYFSSFAEFCDFAEKNPTGLERAALVIDGILADSLVKEEVYAQVLREKHIPIPVLNAGACDLFYEKMLLPELLSDNDKLIPKTWCVSEVNYQEILKDIQTTAIENFVLKLPASTYRKSLN